MTDDSTSKTLKEYAEEAWEIAEQNGFHEGDRSEEKVVALIHSEISEALEADRSGKGEGYYAEELADVIIRILDHAMEKCGDPLEYMSISSPSQISIEEAIDKSITTFMDIHTRSIPSDAVEYVIVAHSYASMAINNLGGNKYHKKLGDLFILTAAHAKKRDVDILGHMNAKMEVNKEREHKHGREY